MPLILQSSVSHDPSEIILICFLIVIKYDCTMLLFYGIFEQLNAFSYADLKRFLALLFVYSKQIHLSDLFECLMCGRQKQSLFFSFVFSAHICIPVALWLPWRIRLLC